MLPSGNFRWRYRSTLVGRLYMAAYEMHYKDTARCTGDAPLDSNTPRRNYWLFMHLPNIWPELLFVSYWIGCKRFPRQCLFFPLHFTVVARHEHAHYRLSALSEKLNVIFIFTGYYSRWGLAWDLKGLCLQFWVTNALKVNIPVFTYGSLVVGLLRED